MLRGRAQGSFSERSRDQGLVKELNLGYSAPIVKASPLGCMISYGRRSVSDVERGGFWHLYSAASLMRKKKSNLDVVYHLFCWVVPFGPTGWVPSYHRFDGDCYSAFMIEGKPYPNSH